MLLYNKHVPWCGVGWEGLSVGGYSAFVFFFFYKVRVRSCQTRKCQKMWNYIQLQTNSFSGLILPSTSILGGKQTPKVSLWACFVSFTLFFAEVPELDQAHLSEWVYLVTKLSGKNVLFLRNELFQCTNFTPPQRQHSTLPCAQQ
jgi:hypothetical protein